MDLAVPKSPFAAVAEATAPETPNLGALPNWNLTDLYKSPTAPEIEQDLKQAAAAASDFRKAYEGRLAAIDGAAFQPCTTPIAECAERTLTTIEGLADGEQLHPVQQAWIDEDVAQCGFCQPGQIMAAVALLANNPNPTDADIDAIENVCRCGTYSRIRAAIKRAATGG